MSANENTLIKTINLNENVEDNLNENVEDNLNENVEDNINEISTEKNNTNILDNIINNNNFNSMISSLSDKLKLNNSELDSDNSNSEYSYSDTETNNDIILDNYLLNSAGENICDILTKINNNLTRIINHTIKN